MPIASGHGVATITKDGVFLDVWYPNPSLAPLSGEPDVALKALAKSDPIREVSRELVSVQIDTEVAPKDAKDAYLRLHLLSHRLIKPHGLSLEGIFGLLTNVVWTNHGPCQVDGFELVRAKLQATHGQVTVYSVDKFPRMVDYVIPSGVRIADADRVRLGAYLSSGTTVMHEGFVNFNAGTLGTSMVEGRISAGVVVGDGSDIGGGASIMGTLSGGGKEVISIGEKSLLGANSGLGISLGDNCVVEAGTYVTAAAKVTLPDGQIVKAAQLSGGNNLLFRRNSQSGALEVVTKNGSWGGLNSILHKN
jgi:2,3,4,5-tetrahydropyridine-2-carboxylate N-succinyltransferase